MSQQERYFTVRFRKEYADFLRVRLDGHGSVLDEADRNEFRVCVYKSPMGIGQITELLGDSVSNERWGVQVNFLNGVKGKAIERGRERL